MRKGKNKWNFSVLISILLAAIMAANLTACSQGTKVKADDLMEGIKSKAVNGKESDERFIGSMAEFSVKLFQKTVTEGENSLVAPLSVVLALAMTTNGADTKTLDEMETLLGGDIPIGELNEYLYTYAKNLPSDKKSKFSIANSIWFRDVERFTVEKEFLQTNASYYDAEIYKSPFGEQTLKDINSWVEDNTDGMIDKIVDQIDYDTVMYLINAIVFDAEWQTIYLKNNMKEGEFTAEDGSVQNADFMYSEEAIYLDDGKAIGFMKPYAGGHYSFVALLPKEGMSVSEYIAALTGEEFLELIKGARDKGVAATTPKFSYDYKIKMNDALKELGMPLAFSPTDADLSRLGHSTAGNLYIGEVLHKTFIAVDEKGTRAGAVTKVEIKEESAPEMEIVTLNRPFVYAIVDNSTRLPVFLGTVMSMEE